VAVRIPSPQPQTPTPNPNPKPQPPVLFGDIGQRAAGPTARALVYLIGCVILQLAATQSLRHALGPAAPSLWVCGGLVVAAMAAMVQVRSLARLSWFFALGTVAQVRGWGARRVG